MINYNSLNIDKIIELDSRDYLVPLQEKIFKLGEEIGAMSTARDYLTIKEYIEETYDSFNIALGIYNTIKGNNLRKDLLINFIEKTKGENKLIGAIPIFYGKICASLLLKMDSNYKSRNSKESDIESYSLELLLLLVAQLKYIYREDIDFESIVDEKLTKWEEKQEDYLSV